MKANLRQTSEELPTDWVSFCGVCEGRFLIREEDSPENPAPHGSFCPDCRAGKLKAPGVLHWTKRKTT